MIDWIGEATLDGLLAGSEIVVLAEVTGVAEVHLVYGSPITDLRVKVKEYLKGSGPDTLLMTQEGDLINTRGTREFPRPAFNRPMLLFLARDSAASGPIAWESRGPYDRMSQVDSRVVYAGEPDYGGREVSWFTGKTLSQAAALIKQELAKPR